MIGETISHYRVVEKLGEGGMGVLYRAIDTRLDRSVAIKVLAAGAASDPDARRRLIREARAASALNHPNIVTIYEVDTVGDLDFIAMERVEGEPLDRRLAEGPLPVTEALRVVREIAEALSVAHAVGILHRDIKPSNVMLTAGGRVKVLDFGLAKRVQPVSVDTRDTTLSGSDLTGEGRIVGTVAYMSPEQAEGARLDARSDVFSLGVVAYELLCGRRPFQGTSVPGLLSSILRDEPPPPGTLRIDIPVAVERIVLRCLEKDPGNRFHGATELAAALRACEQRMAERGRAGPRAVLVGGAVAAAVVATVAAVLWVRATRAREAVDALLAEADRLVDAGDYYGAFRVASGPVRADPRHARVLGRVTLPATVVTEPPGAEIHITAYGTPDGPWHFLGRSPVENARVPYGLMRWRFTKPGYEALEVAPIVAGGQRFVLEKEAGGPKGMVRVPRGRVVYREEVPVELDEFWVDTYEVTNREYKAFVDAGGYERLDAAFRDATGRPGPSGWQLGAYPDGQDELPVAGISWYEARAYCESAGKALPTVHHWRRAAAFGQLSDILAFSNFKPAGPAPVGRFRGLGPFGTYDMAGNVKEWCWNAAGSRRFALGGAWRDPPYMYEQVDAASPGDRSPVLGVRCARYGSPPPEPLLAPVELEPVAAGRAVTDDVFEAYRSLYAYDRLDLAPAVEAVDDSDPHFRREQVSFTTGYGGERMTAFVFLPRNTALPYQVVVWFPGADAYLFDSSTRLASEFLFDFLPRTGRAVVYPILKGMYERRLPPGKDGQRARPMMMSAEARRDLFVLQIKDYARTVDYISTRSDLDRGRIAHYGFSSGAFAGPIVAALDTRLRTSILLAGGLRRRREAAEVDAASFASRVRVPVLMLNGQDDFLHPLEEGQRPLFRLLGTPEKDKRHAVIPGGHIPDHLALVREVTSWLDRQFGAPRRSGR